MTTIMKRKQTVVEKPDKIEKEHHVVYIRLPHAVLDRLNHQSRRLSCSMSTLARMSIIKFLEEEEIREQS
jgi:hypothetical protein